MGEMSESTSRDTTGPQQAQLYMCSLTKFCVHIQSRLIKEEMLP
jgi:hypothetical protein